MKCQKWILACLWYNALILIIDKRSLTFIQTFYQTFAQRRIVMLTVATISLFSFSYATGIKIQMCGLVDFRVNHWLQLGSQWENQPGYVCVSSKRSTHKQNIVATACWFSQTSKVSTNADASNCKMCISNF